MRIRAFLEIALKTEMGFIHDRELPSIVGNLDKSESRKIVVNRLYQEILVELETLHVDRIQCAIRDARLLPGFFIRSAELLPAMQLKAQEELAKNIAAQIAALPDNREFCLSGGWDKHAIYINFMRRGNKIIVRVDNLGRGLDERYPRGHQKEGQYLHLEHKDEGVKKNRFYSCLLGETDREWWNPETNPNFTLPYIQNLIQANFESEADAFPKIYNFNSVLRIYRHLTDQSLQDLKLPAGKAQTNSMDPPI